MGYTILSILYLLLFALLTLIMMPLTWIVRKCNLMRGDRMALGFVQWGFRCVVCTTGMKLKVHGIENIPKNRAVLYVGNHRSIFDIVVSYGKVPDRTGFIGKEELSKIPVVSPWMRRIYCLFLPREDMKKSLQVILTATDQLKQGISMAIFPEGTRNKTEELLQPFKNGAFKPAEKAGAPILPMAVSYDGPVLETSFPHLKRMNVVLRFGELIETEGLSREDKKEIPKKSFDAVKNLLIENEKELGH